MENDWTPAQKEMSAFLTGHAHGCIGDRTPQTPRQVSERFPAWTAAQVDCYLNGEDDAIRCDSWRMIRIRAQLYTERGLPQLA